MLELSRGPVVVYDANVLYPAPLRDLLVRVGLEGMVQAKWSKDILNEAFAHIATNRPDLSPGQLKRSRRLLEASIRGAMVTGYRRRIEALSLPDPDDRHVLAAAIEAGAHYIVSFDRSGFPARTLHQHRLARRTPDALICELIELHGAARLCGVVRRQAAALRNPPLTVEGLLDILESKQRLRRAVPLLRAHM